MTFPNLSVPPPAYPPEERHGSLFRPTSPLIPTSDQYDHDQRDLHPFRLQPLCLI
ncbi:hypothetical protein BT69DRAFT_1283421 [Atractiella rhizophila]|nr:hypothetical protein BT69DRAFT_1283421 [Atractiella rhizophila]